jgi:hypothetical protein
LILALATRIAQLPGKGIVKRGNFVIAATLDGFLCYARRYLCRSTAIEQMKSVCLGLLVALISWPAFGQNKEQDRVANAGKVRQEIMNVPDDIPQSVIDKADCVVVCPQWLNLPSELAGATAGV